MIIEATHACMTCRGVRKDASRLVTLASSGIYGREPAARREILELFGRAGPEPAVEE